MQQSPTIFKWVLQNPASNNVKINTFSIKSNISKHIKKQENTTHNQEKNQSVDTDPEMREIVELAYIKIPFINIFHMLKKVEENMNMREIEGIKASWTSRYKIHDLTKSNWMRLLL